MPLDETIEILVNRAFSNNSFNTTHNFALTRTDLVDLLSVATKGQLFQFNGALYEQTDSVAMGSPLGSLIANVIMSSIEDTLERQGKRLSFYRRYVAYTLTVMPDLATATTFLHTLNSAHTSVKFAFEVEKPILLLLDNRVMKTPKRRFLSLIFACNIFLSQKINVDSEYEGKLNQEKRA